MHNIVNPNDTVVLILTEQWLPYGQTTARYGIRDLMADEHNKQNPIVRAVCPAGQLKWSDWINPEKAAYYEDQPYLRTARQLFPVPTILLTGSRYFYQTKERPVKRDLYKYQKGKCKMCHKDFHIRDLTIDHVYPKSKGGPKETWNSALLCKPCNVKKSNLLNVRDVQGNLIEGTVRDNYLRYLNVYRKEWIPFLFK